MTKTRKQLSKETKAIQKSAQETWDIFDKNYYNLCKKYEAYDKYIDNIGMFLLGLLAGFFAGAVVTISYLNFIYE